MSASRRRFLRMAGTAALGAAAGCTVGCGRRDLAPSPAGARLGMAIDVRKCLRDDGCRACIDACHSAHNVPSIPDRGHEVKWIWKERFDRVFPDDGLGAAAEVRDRDVLVLCNHCDNPPCVRVCPAGATWKRGDGIVTIDEHRCIGCRYCVAACPYGSRSFNWTDPRPFVRAPNRGYPTRSRGVVEKCSFCEERVGRGEAPYCVAACPEGALIFGDLADPGAGIRRAVASRYALRRRPELGTKPQVCYLV
jgi:Fe-S-cluster-containing dehydrogenase component